jgi:endonuclease-3
MGKKVSKRKAAGKKVAKKADPVRFEGVAFEVPGASESDRSRALEILGALEAAYPGARCELDFTSPHELLIATILSAQSTDVGVNKATPALFKAFPTPADYVRAGAEGIEPYIKTIGLFRNKAKSIHQAMQVLVEKFGGEVPRTMDELLTLRGVARKTANVVLGNAFGVNVGFVVDTHVERLSTRLGLVEAGSNVAAIEKRLMSLFPQNRWCDISHMLIFHGRRACKARSVACGEHPICAAFACDCDLRR